jgi:uncharacterized protein (TIGR03067 family)
MRTVLKTLGLAALLLLAAPVLSEEQSKSGREAVEQLLGSYTIVSGERFGEPEQPERIQGTLVYFTRNEIRVTDKDSKELYVATYKVDPTKKPWAITMTSTVAPVKGEVVKGLIEKEGDTIRLIYALPRGETPKNFKTKERQLLFVMKSLKQ